eukprot:Phypoly_transcript_10398.p1 GENE.Phypoly_transcript_10398~~Phypoly_transcript_10398.p1  ORF type:complete len:308 (+),score=28.79 Phypoly_transcript_10398:81-1004(+)
MSSSIFTLSLFLLVLNLTASHVIPEFSSHSPKTRWESEQKKPQPRVLINSLPRSGSTFIGELFNQNPESAYLYEATRTIGEVFANDSCAAEPDDRIGQIIASLFNCDYAKLKDYMAEISKTKGSREYVFTWNHVEHNSSPGKCKVAAPSTIMIAIKEIVLWGPKLKWLLSEVPNLKIIWLVRDVRGLVSSFVPFLETDKRENMYYNWGVNNRPLWVPYDNCKWINISQSELDPLRALLEDKRAPPHKRMAAWWTMEQKMMLSVLAEIPLDKWMLVKYEDMSMYPLEVAQQVTIVAAYHTFYPLKFEL